MKKTKRIFLDYASATPLDSRVFKAMKPYFETEFHNPSSLYEEGVSARKAVEASRERFARAIGSRKDEIVFTSGGTESINIALLGIYAAAWKKAQKTNPDFVPHIVTSQIEHPAVLETCRHLESWGGKVTYLPPREDGRIHPEDVRKALAKETVLVTLMHVNNEIGMINPLRDIAREIRSWKDSNGRDLTDGPYFHTDASQSPNYLDIRKETLGIDLMTLDGSKIYGPKGVGILFKKHFIDIEPTLFGGSQEKGIRPGTENVALIVGFAEALDLAVKMREKESVRIAKIRDYCLGLLEKKFADRGFCLNGSLENRVPNNLNFCINGLYAEFAVIQLDAKGIAVSSVTACRNPDEETFSHVVAALPAAKAEKNSRDVEDCSRSSLRVTFGRMSAISDARSFIEILSEILSKATSGDKAGNR